MIFSPPSLLLGLNVLVVLLVVVVAVLCAKRFNNDPPEVTMLRMLSMQMFMNMMQLAIARYCCDHAAYVDDAARD